MNHPDERLDAWYDGSAICLIAVGAHGAPLDLGNDAVRALIAKLQHCLAESDAAARDDRRLTAQAGASTFSIATLARLMPLGCAYASSRKATKPAAR